MPAIMASMQIAIVAMAMQKYSRGKRRALMDMLQSCRDGMY
jgi:hypothetical protein